MTSPSYMPGAVAPTGPAQPAPKNRLPWIVAAAAVALAVILGVVVVAMSGDKEAPVAAAASSAPAPPSIETPDDVAREVRQRSGLECARPKPIDNPTGAAARSSCNAGQGEIIISTYASSADATAHWATYSATLATIGDVDMAIGDNWTVSGDDSTYIRKAAEVLGGRYETTAKGGAAQPTDLFPAVGTPVAKDFKLSVKILRKKCFGSAGCNIDYRIDVTYAGDPLALAEGRQYEVTYEVKGAEDPIVNTFTMDGSSASVDAEESTTTSSSSKKLTAVATSVTEM